MEYSEFISVFGRVVEHSAGVAGAVWSRRPFDTGACVVGGFVGVLDSLSGEVKAGILRVHPDLGARLELTEESRGEQVGAGLGTLSESERVALREGNEEYKRRFGFPFVICVRETNKKDAILKGLAERLRNSPEEELQTGFNEVKKIAALRIGDILAANPNLLPIK